MNKDQQQADRDITKKFKKQNHYGYYTSPNKDQKAPKVFIFPKSREGLQTVKSKAELAKLLIQKFNEDCKDMGVICPYEITEAKGTNPMKVEQHKLTAACRICTNALIYVKNMFTQNEFKLVKLSDYHVHGKDPHMVEEILRTKHNYSRFTNREGRPMEIKPLYIDQHMESNIEEYIKSLPTQMTNPSRCKVVCERFKITKIQYENVMRSINNEFDISFKELLANLQNKSYTVLYLPQRMLEQNEELIKKQKQNQFQISLMPYDSNRIKDVHKIDRANPDIPNVLLIISPQMKELYHKYGQYIGFDLTFSLIRQKPEHQKQYLVGVFAGTSESRRILVYGLIITNSQSIEVYKYLFKNFIQIMGKSPETIVTDEQMSLHYALKQLKEEGTFTGHHCLDMFHILKKFRKSCERDTFQLFRKLMHSKDRLQYRKWFNEIMEQVSNDEELNLIRNFDLNSQRYCYSQSLNTFIGIGISDSMNQKFHDLIKTQLPYESKYIKAVNVMVELIASRNEMNRFGAIDKTPIEQKMNMPFLKQYRTILSDKIFHLLLKEVCKSLPYIILTNEQQIQVELKQQKIQQGQRYAKKSLHNKDKFIIKGNLGSFIVEKKYYPEAAINEHKRFPNGKWICNCEFQDKSGFLCSHIIKVVMTLGEQFYDNIHPRWIIRQDQIQQSLIKFIHRERKFHHFTRVRMRRTPKWTNEEDDADQHGINDNKRNGEFRKILKEDDEISQQNIDDEEDPDCSSFFSEVDHTNTMEIEQEQEID